MTITINLKGRLGNQLFQYAVLRNLSIKKGFNFYINTQLEWHGQSNLLNQFNIKESDILNEIYYIYSQPVNSNYYDININNINDNTILDGHFENVEYFTENLELIKNELSIKNNDIITFSENFINEIRKDDSKIVGIHFRRGDIIQEMENIDEFNNNCKKFVYESLEKITRKETRITLLIFTGGIREKGSGYGWIDYAHEDDLKWVNTFLIENQSIFNIHISPGTIENNVLIDYYLISQCDYFISPRQSTFSFMACYLSKKKIKIFSPTNLYGAIDDNSKKKICPIVRNDGFGAQFQTIIFTILYAEMNNLEYVHRNIKEMEHNYDNDIDFIYKITNCMNIHGNYLDISSIDNYNDFVDVNIIDIYKNIECNIDFYTNNNNSINKIKNCFWKNKDKNVYKNNKFNIAVHIRVMNSHDNRNPEDTIPFDHYLNIVQYVREKNKDKDILFHIYSQGNIERFGQYISNDVIFHLNEDLCKTFIGLVGADALITSPSSFSYIAAILSDAEIYYVPFWHKPKSNWIIL